jgi:hypothetical protein
MAAIEKGDVDAYIGYIFDINSSIKDGTLKKSVMQQVCRQFVRRTVLTYTLMTNAAAEITQSMTLQ